MVTDICSLTAAQASECLARGELQAVDLLEAAVAQIQLWNDRVNAIITLDLEGAVRQAREIDRQIAGGMPGGRLRGIPIAIKDLEDTAGIRTTYGSPLFERHVPDRDSLLVARIKKAGMVVIGKTNTPEFGAGSHTYNRVFGATRNPYDVSRSAGGSSGGAAVAVATGMTALADGSDYAASIRNPAAFCNVVGLRPSPGRWPSSDPDGDEWDPLPVAGPIGRTVDDVAMFYAALLGEDARCGLSLPTQAQDGQSALKGGLEGVRVAWSDRLGDLPVHREVTEVLRQVRPVFEDLGASVLDAEPYLPDVDQAFEILRAVSFLRDFGRYVDAAPTQVKDTVRWNVAEAAKIGAAQIAYAQRVRSNCFHRFAEFLSSFDVLALPTVQVPPFPIEWPWVREIEGVPLLNYLQWMRSCSRITMTCHPCLSLPGGFTSSGLPIGLQLVGRYRGEDELLRIGAAFENATGFGRIHPSLIAPPRALR